MTISWWGAGETISLSAKPLVAFAVEGVKFPTFEAVHLANNDVLDALAAVSVKVVTLFTLEVEIWLLVWATAVHGVTA